MPLPGATLQGGSVIDYAVLMVRLPDEAMLEVQVRTGKVTPGRLREIGEFVAAFHASACTDEHIARFGKPAVIRGNWEENVEQMRPYIGRTLDQATYDRIVGYGRQFMQARTALFEGRVQHGQACRGVVR